MSWISALAIYFIIWWVVLFAVLPWGNRTQDEEGDIVAGSNPSAPARPRLLAKALVTTLVSAVVFAGVWWLIVESGLTLDDVPLPNPLDAMKER